MNKKQLLTTLLVLGLVTGAYILGSEKNNLQSTSLTQNQTSNNQIISQTVSPDKTKELILKKDNIQYYVLIKDLSTGLETNVMTNPKATELPADSNNWTRDGKYFFIQTRDIGGSAGDNIFIFKADQSTFPSGKKSISATSLGLANGQYITSAGWVYGGGITGTILGITTTPVSSLKKSYLNMDTFKLMPSLPSPE